MLECTDEQNGRTKAISSVDFAAQMGSFVENEGSFRLGCDGVLWGNRLSQKIN